jgi:membrane fusion protein (multidrug efflux system)
MRTNILLITSCLLLFFSCKEESKITMIPEISVVEVTAENVPIYQDYVGQIFGIKDIPIRARVDGFLDGIHFEEGSRIQKGKLIYTIDPQPFVANRASKQSLVSEAQTNLAYANSEYGRIKPLADANAVSQSDLDGATAEKEAAEAGLEAAKANLEIADIDLSYTRIHSPIKGVIGKTNAREGEYVGKSPNPVILTTVSQIEVVRVQFFLTEAEYLFLAKEVTLKKGKENERKAEFSLVLSDGSTHDHKGELDFVDRGVDSETGTILVQTSFPNPDLILRPGQFGRLRITIEEEKGVVIVPQRCVSELQGQYSVFVVDAENKIESRQIKIGPKYNDYYIVREGLDEKDKVVLEGLQKVRGGMEVIPKVVDFKSQMESIDK